MPKNISIKKYTSPHKNKILICPPKKKDLLFQNVMVHQVWKNRKPVATAACPRIDDGEECKVCQYGWDSKPKHEDSKNKKKARNSAKDEACLDCFKRF